MEAEQFYAVLLRLYPAAFRQEYESEMRAAFRRRRRDEPTPMGRAFLWLSVLADTLLTASQEHFDMLIRDIRYSLRALRKTPAFTIAALTTLALGIGATTAIYSLVHAVLLRSLPFAEPDRLVRISETNKPLNIPDFSASYLNFLSWQEQSRSFETLAAFQNETATLTGDGEPQRVTGAAVSANFWSITGLKPILGRGFLTGEDVAGKENVVMLSQGLWQQRYAGDPEIVGKTVLVNGVPQTVVGIAPQDAGYTQRVEFWTPLARDPAQESRGNHVISVLGRLRRGVNLAAADAELNTVAERLEQEFPKSNGGWRVHLTPVKNWIVDSDSRTSLYVLLAAAGLLLTVACANVAGLLVTRATARAHEFGVRLALGAGRARLTRQLATESLVLAFIGGGFGILIALAAVRWLATRVTTQLPRTANLTVEWPVFVFAFGLTIAVGLVFGLAPSWAVRKADAVTTLRRTASRSTTGTSGALLRLGLVGGQIAVATMLVAGALLLIQSFERLQKVDVGFRPDHLLTVSINLPEAKYPTQEQAEAFYGTLLSEIRAVPGVLSAGVTSGVPMGGINTSMSVVPIERQAGVPERGIQALWRWATEDYLQTLHVPLRRGAFFDTNYSKRSSIVLSESLARHLWPDGKDPIGQQVKLANDQVFTVIGIVGDVRLTDLRTEPVGAMYFKPFFGGTLTLAIRTAVDPATLTGPVRDVVTRIDPAQPVFNVRTMDRIVEDNAGKSRLQTTLLTCFACLALLLGAVGVAGVVSYTVERRAPELALRLALGATPAQAMYNAARGALTSSGIGLVFGLLGAWGLSRSLSTLLFKVRPDDPATFSSVGALLLAVAVIACLLPARRAMRIDPAAALKQRTPCGP